MPTNQELANCETWEDFRDLCDLMLDDDVHEIHWSFILSVRNCVEDYMYFTSGQLKAITDILFGVPA